MALTIALGIRIVKYYAWEDAFFNNIDKFREAELAGVKRIGYTRSTLITLLQGIITAALGLTIVSIKKNFPVCT